MSMVEYVHFFNTQICETFYPPPPKKKKKTNMEPEKNTQNAKMNIIFPPPSFLGSKC